MANSCQGTTGKAATKLVVFDLDGTLLDTIEAISYHVNQTLERHGYARISTEKVNDYVGNSSKYLIDRSLEEAVRVAEKSGSGVVSQAAKAAVAPIAETAEELASQSTRKTTLPTAEEAERIVEEYNAAYLADPVDRTTVYPGVLDVLATLRDAGVEIGIFSNKPDSIVQRVVAGLFDTSLFSYIRGQRDDTPRKPDPTGLVEIMKQAGVDKEAVLYLGDTDVDMAVGKGADVKTIAVTWGFRSAEELRTYAPWRMIDRPEELLALLSER